MYLFTTAAISQTIPPCRKGSFHASIPDLFPSPSCRAEWSHFLDAGAVPLGYGNSHHRWHWCMARRGRQHHAWPPGVGSKETPPGGSTEVVRCHTRTHPSGRDSSVLLPWDPPAYPEHFLSSEKAVPLFRRSCQQTCVQLMS